MAALGATSVLIAASVLAMLLAFAEKVPCRSGAWNYDAKQFQDACYTDIYPLYYTEGLSAGKVPYTGHPVEYPVLIGGAMQAAAWLVRNINVAIRGREFFDFTVILLAVCAVAAVLATARAAGPDARWQGLMVALSPALILNAFVNWDLIAMALTALGLAAWAARRGVWAGALLGLAVATKFYPLVVLGALLLLCLRAAAEGLRQDLRRRRGGLAGGQPAGHNRRAVRLGHVLRVQQAPGRRLGLGLVHVRVFQPAQTRGFPAQRAQRDVRGGPDRRLRRNRAARAGRPRRPRLPQVCFLLLATFLMTNKVWSPQYVIWLVPLAVLARPRLWPYALWQLAEIGYFFGIWGYLIFATVTHPVAGYQGISTGWYFTLLVARFLTVALLAAYVVRDILYPERDVVRARGHDDPAGGVLDQAPDRFRIHLARPVSRAGALPHQ